MVSVYMTLSIVLKLHIVNDRIPKSLSKLASPQTSPGDEMIAQVFGFRGVFSKERNTDCIFD